MQLKARRREDAPILIAHLERLGVTRDDLLEMIRTGADSWVADILGTNRHTVTVLRHWLLVPSFDQSCIGNRVKAYRAWKRRWLHLRLETRERRGPAVCLRCKQHPRVPGRNLCAACGAEPRTDSRAQQPWVVRPHQVRDLAYVWGHVVRCRYCELPIAAGDRVRWVRTADPRGPVHVACERGR